MDCQQFEQKFVRNAYSKFASAFNHTRHNSWSTIASFINDLPAHSNVLDAGCGNGRNMILRKDIIMTGFDACQELVKICQEKNLDVFYSDIRLIAIKDETFDSVICIAVLGHIFHEADRIKAINELLRVTKKGGNIFISVWDIYAAQKSKDPSKFVQLSGNDYIVTWGLEKIERYYHLFDEHEMKQLLEKCNCCIKKIFVDTTGVISIITKI